LAPNLRGVWRSSPISDEIIAMLTAEPDGLPLYSMSPTLLDVADTEGAGLLLPLTGRRC
jgi:hypothetical protein